jgi:hypothetical protein
MSVDFNKFKFGSAKVFFGDTIASLSEVGSAKGVSFEYKVETVKIKSGNYKNTSREIVKSREADIKFTLQEYDFEKLANMQGIDIFEVIPGTLVADATQTLTDGKAHTFYPLANQNGDGSIITVDSITGLTTDTDYDVVKDEVGIYGIVLEADFSGDKTITYDYTPAATKKFKTGTAITIKPKVIKLVNTDANGKEFRIVAEYAKKTNGIAINFPDAESDEEATTEVNINATQDPDDSSKPVFYIEDEQ